MKSLDVWLDAPTWPGRSRISVWRCVGTEHCAATPGYAEPRVPREDKPLDLILQDPEQDACSVSWFLEQQTAPATFLVVGKDRAGMWRILKSGLGLERIDLSSGETERFEELSVLAVSGSGLEDARRTRLHPSHCLVYPDLPVNLLQFSKPVENWSSGSLVLLLVGLLSCALSSSALVLYCIYSWRRR